MSSRLLEIYKEFTSAIEMDIGAFEKRSRDLVEDFKKTTTETDDMKKLSIIESQIDIRCTQVRQLGRNILMNIENASLALHSPEITDWIAEEVKKKNAGTVSQMTPA